MFVIFILLDFQQTIAKNLQTFVEPSCKILKIQLEYVFCSKIYCAFFKCENAFFIRCIFHSFSCSDTYIVLTQFIPSCISIFQMPCHTRRDSSEPVHFSGSISFIFWLKYLIYLLGKWKTKSYFSAAWLLAHDILQITFFSDYIN